jgi:hypothetical protein
MANLHRGLMLWLCAFGGPEEPTHKVSERTAFYLGGDNETKIKNYELMKEAYDIRSKFVHGQELDKKYKLREPLVEKF